MLKRCRAGLCARGPLLPNFRRIFLRGGARIGVGMALFTLEKGKKRAFGPERRITQARAALVDTRRRSI